MRSAAVDVVTLEEAQADLDEVLGRAVNDSIPVIVSRPRGESVVVISLSEWNSMQETAHVFGTAANRRALDDAVAELDAGRGIEVALGPDGVYRPVTKAAAE